MDAIYDMHGGITYLPTCKYVPCFLGKCETILEGEQVLSGLMFLALAPKSLLRLLQNMLQSCLLLKNL